MPLLEVAQRRLLRSARRGALGAGREQRFLDGGLLPLLHLAARHRRHLQQQRTPIPTQQPEIGARLRPDGQALPDVEMLIGQALQPREDAHGGGGHAADEGVGEHLRHGLLHHGATGTPLHQVAQHLHRLRLVGVVGLCVQNVATAHQNELGARARHRHVQPFGLEKEGGQVAGKGGVGGREGGYAFCLP